MTIAVEPLAAAEASDWGDSHRDRATWGPVFRREAHGTIPTKERSSSGFCCAATELVHRLWPVA